MGKKFLIGQLACFGDCLYATVIARQIKHDYPDGHVTWAIAEKYKSILDNNPYVDEIWEIPGTDNSYFYEEGWDNFEKEALRRKVEGIYDELIFSQLPNKNWKNFDGTIRSSILRAYHKPITVPVAPVVRLADEEVKNVEKFARKYKLESFKHVILFECAPGSSQSSVNVEFALEVARKVCREYSDVCFIISTAKAIKTHSSQIIDGSELSFRENAELSKYCTLLIGCSSGISWLCTSDWAKKLNMIQIIKRNFCPFPGVAYDFELWGVDNKHIIEFEDSQKEDLPALLHLLLSGGFEIARKQYHCILKPEEDCIGGLMVTMWKHCRRPFLFIKLFFRILYIHRHMSFIKMGYFTLAYFWALIRTSFKDKGI
jgi:hypothetical protein